MRTAALSVVALLAFTMASPLAQDATPRIWATHDGTKVLRDDTAHPDRERNAIWDGSAVRLVAARNETVAFQVIVEAKAPISRLSAALATLAHPGGTVLGEPHVEVFSQHYLHVTRRSRASWVFRDSAAPTTPIGWVPVALVPSDARAGRGGFPLAVDAGRNQGLWIEIHVPAAAAHGVYQGEVVVTLDDAQRRLPVHLEVLEVTLPDQPTLPAMVYYERAQTDLYHGRNMDAAYHAFAHRHRVEFTHAYTDETAMAARARFDGTAFSPAAGYTGPGAANGNRILPRTFYSPGQDFATPESTRASLARWAATLNALSPALTFVYLPDEPTPAQFPRVREVGLRVRDAARQLGSPVKTFLTHGYTPELADAVDIWAAVPAHYDAARAREERKAGKQVWFYNGGRPYIGAIVIDAPATDSRVVGWAAFRHDADGYFYWHANHWRHNSQMKIGDRNQDVWQQPITFDNRAEGKEENGFINGDGVLVYPGEDVLHPEQDRGHRGPVGTIQLANLRRGLQDHMLLTMARERGLQREVAAALDAVVPRVLSDAGETAGFSEDGNEWEATRQTLLRAIATAPSRRN